TSNFEHVGHRLEMFSNPDEADSDDVYQITQAIIAIGSGGLQGVGLGKGRQKYNYLPEAHNDYVFAIIGEELGFIGTVLVLLLFVAFLISGVMISLRAKNNYTAMLAAGYTGLISIQAFLNMGVATRLLPSTGISLPFFSYGGTSNIFFLVAVGFLLAVSRTGQQSRRKNDTTRQRPQQSAKRRPVKREEGQRL
ncbi:MAG: cell division protein FtsW, partial [Clostridiales bacterium]|nr:cell division protein FtsW [Clostridiales bacterium]